MLTGFLGVATPQAFWFVGGGNAWRFDTDWIAEPQPPAPEWSAVRAVAPLGNSLLYIVQEGIDVYSPSPYAVYDRERAWQRMPLGTMDFEQVVVTGKAVMCGSSFS